MSEWEIIEEVKDNASIKVIGVGGGGGNPLDGLMGSGNQRQTQKRPGSPARSDMSGPDGLDDLMNAMNTDNIPDLDNLSLMSGDTDRKSGNGGITLNL